MKFSRRIILGVSLVCLTGIAAGCGSSSDNVAGPSGRLVQGPVVNATVFADNVEGGVRFTLDGTEVKTTTDSVTGDFVLPATPGYNYILVSKGGTDRLTGQAALQMIAPAGAANVTPFTTLVALDTTNSLKAKLETLMPPGAKYDADISTTASEAVLLVAKSVETMVHTLMEALVMKAGAGQISDKQLSFLQAQTMQAVAAHFAASTVNAATLSDPVSLSSTLQAAATAAVTSLRNSNNNLNIPDATAASIAADSVTATVGALNIGTPASTTPIVGGENAAMTQQAAQAFVNAVQSQATTYANSIIASATPVDYTAPTIEVVTPITVPDTTGATGGNTGGTGVTF